MDYTDTNIHADPLRVLHIMSGFGGGISSFIHNKAVVMQKYHITFDVVTYDDCSDEFVAAIRATGGDVYQLKNPKKDGWKVFKRSFTRVLSMYNYDIVYSHIDGYRVLPYYYYAWKHNIDRFYIHAHQSYQFGENIRDQLNANANQYINRTLTEAYVGCGRQAIWGVFGEGIHLKDMMMIPNSLDLADYDISDEKKASYRKEMRQKYGFTKDNFIIGQIGRYEHVKNHRLTIELANYMKQNNLKGQIISVGDGNLKEDIRAEVQKRDLADILHIKDREDDIEAFMFGLDAIILPSFYEGLPTVVVEAQAAGVPVVMADTVTDEADLNMELVTAIPLESSQADWYQALKDASQKPVMSLGKRSFHFTRHSFTNESSGLLYVKFLRQDITHYRIK